MDLRQRVDQLMERAEADLAQLVAIPSVADPRQYPPEECARAAQWVLDAFVEEGFRDAHLEETADGSHAVIGSRACPDPDAFAVNRPGAASITGTWTGGEFVPFT